jgi:hypothetical protein
MHAPGDIDAIAVAQDKMIVSADQNIHIVNAQSNTVEGTISNMTAQQVAMSSDDSDMMLVTPNSIVSMDNPLAANTLNVSQLDVEFLYSAEEDELLVDFIITPGDDAFILSVYKASGKSVIKFLKNDEENEGDENPQIEISQTFSGIAIGITASVDFDVLYVTVNNPDAPGAAGSALLAFPINHYLGTVSSSSILASFSTDQVCEGHSIGKVSVHQDTRLVFLSGHKLMNCDQSHVVAVSPLGGIAGHFTLPNSPEVLEFGEVNLKAFGLEDSQTNLPLVATPSRILVGQGSSLFQLPLVTQQLVMKAENSKRSS